MQVSALDQVFEQLQTLSSGAFPKRCDNCGKDYSGLGQLVAETQTQQGSGLKQVVDGLGPQVEIERICGCGSLLTEVFNDRRCRGEISSQRRILFDRLFCLLTEGGMPNNMAKKELLKVMKGQPSDLLNKEQLIKFFC